MSFARRSRQTSLTNDSAILDEQGKARFVIAKEDPGHANWIDLNDYHRGFMIFRWVEGDNVLPPKVKLLKQDQALAFMAAPDFE